MELLQHLQLGTEQGGEAAPSFASLPDPVAAGVLGLLEAPANLASARLASTHWRGLAADGLPAWPSVTISARKLQALDAGRQRRAFHAFLTHQAPRLRCTFGAGPAIAPLARALRALGSGDGLRSLVLDDASKIPKVSSEQRASRAGSAPRFGGLPLCRNPQ